VIVDEFELYAKVAQAWELGGSPYFIDAVAAVIEAYDRAPLTWFEWREQRHARNLWLIRLLRETDPDRPIFVHAEAA
jgi:hypothetical protein